MSRSTVTPAVDVISEFFHRLRAANPADRGDMVPATDPRGAELLEGEQEALSEVLQSEYDPLHAYAALKVVECSWRERRGEGEVSPIWLEFLKRSNETGHYEEVCREAEAMGPAFLQAAAGAPQQITLFNVEARPRKSLGQFNRAQRLLGAALDLATRESLLEIEAHIHIAIGKIFGKYLGHIGQYARCIRTAKTILERARRNASSEADSVRLLKGLAICHDCLGTLYGTMHEQLDLEEWGNAPELRQHLERALEINRKIGNSNGESRNIAHLAMLRLRSAERADLDKIAKDLRQSLDIIRGDERHQRGAGLRQAQYGYVVAKMENRQGLRYIRTGLETVERLRCFRNIVKIKTYYGEALGFFGKVDAAERQYREALEIASGRGLILYQIHCAKSLGQIASSAGKLTQAFGFKKDHYDSIRILRDRFERYIPDSQEGDAERTPGEQEAWDMIADYRRLTGELSGSNKHLLNVLEEATKQRIGRSMSYFGEMAVHLMHHTIRHDMTHVRMAMEGIKGLLNEIRDFDGRQDLLDTATRGEHLIDDILLGLTTEATSNDPVSLHEVLTWVLKQAKLEQLGNTLSGSASGRYTLQDTQWLRRYRVDVYPSLVRWAFWGLVRNAMEAQDRASRQVHIWVEHQAGGAVCMANPVKDNNGEPRLPPDGFVERWIEERQLEIGHEPERGKGLLVIDEILGIALKRTLRSRRIRRYGQDMFCVMIVPREDEPGEAGP